MGTNDCFGIKGPIAPVIQADLSNGDRRMTTWLDARSNLKEGVSVTLKQIDGLWKVVKLWPQIHSATDFDWHRKWDNNI